MNDREKKLTAAVGLLVVLWGSYWGWNKYSTWLQNAQNEKTSVATQLQEAELDLAKARTAVRNLQTWQEQSLPASVATAQAEYRGWLVEQLQSSRLDVDSVTPRRVTGRNNAYQPVSYQIEATGKLKSVVEFLDKFYRSDLLHKISNLQLTPRDAKGDLQVSLAVEALVVEGTKREKDLPEGTSDRLLLASADEYVSSIVGRDPFAEYVKPRPPRIVTPRVVEDKPPVTPTPRPSFDHAKYAKITGLVSVGDDYQAWVWAKTLDDKRLRLNRGDKIDIGEFEGTVVDVTQDELVVETDEGLWVFRLGETLSDGRLLVSASTGG